MLLRRNKGGLRAWIGALACLLSLTATAVAAELVGNDGQRVDVKDPKRIVALNYSTVELLIALGMGERIVGTDITGIPLLAGRSDVANFGHPYRPSMEGVIAAAPDLVVATADSFLTSPAAQLRGAGIPVLVLEPSYKDGVAGLKRRLAMLARALDKMPEGDALIAQVDKRAETLRANSAGIAHKKRVFFLYTHGPGSAFIYGKGTGTDYLIELAGGVNAADFTEGTKPLTPEAMVASNPDAIILLERGVEAVGGMDGAKKLPGVSLTSAARDNAMFTVDNNVRWIGLRWLDDAEDLQCKLYSAP